MKVKFEFNGKIFTKYVNINIEIKIEIQSYENRKLPTWTCVKLKGVPKKGRLVNATVFAFNNTGLIISNLFENLYP